MMTLKRLIFVFFLLTGCLSLLAQQPVEIWQIEELINSLQLSGGDILFAKRFNNYLDQFTKLKNFTQTRPLSEIEKSDLKRLYQLFEELNQYNDDLRPYFTSILEARRDALTNEANDFSPLLFQEAEKALQELAERLMINIPGNTQQLQKQTKEVR